MLHKTKFCAAIAAGLLITLAGSMPAQTGDTNKTEPPEQRQARLRWWRDGRFGLFIHWGPVSLTGKEISWSRANSNPKCPNNGPTPAAVYDTLYKQFNPTNFNAAEWVDMARTTGMKYMVLTAKHCDGFLLWHSQADRYNMASTPFQRDICQELTTAARGAGMKIGWYFSPMDWRDPDFRTARNPVFLDRIQAELRELLGNYGRIDLLWFDWDGREPLYDQSKTYALVRKAQPNIVINNRLDLGISNNDNQLLSANADYYTPEQRIGHYDDQHPWETCMTLGTQWSWKPDDTIKPAKEVISILARTVGGDGNLLLNVGPMPDGRVEPRQVEVLRQVGAWMKENGESIYGTRGGPFKPSPALASTCKGNVVYVHLLKGHDEMLTLPALPKKIIASQLLNGREVRVAQNDSGITLTVPKPDSNQLSTIIKLVLDGSAESIPVLDVVRQGLIKPGMKTTASNVYQKNAGYGPGKAIDGDDETRWATDGGQKTAWLEVDMGKPATFDRVEIGEAFAERVQSFELQCREGNEWRTFYRGTTLSDHFTARFAAVTAQRVRFNVLKATDGPTITEFQLFPPNTPPITVASYYFGNYHPNDPRNEKNKGKGWSEWELVKAAKPRFPGHHQPNVPLWGYTDESDPAAMAQKIAAAADHGINAFIFDWYYYNDGPFLDRPIDLGFLQATNRARLKFAFMWANHDWAEIQPYKRGTPQKVLFPGEVTPANFEKICDHVIRDYFQHPSYWRIDGQPYFSFYELTKLLANFGTVEATRVALDKFRAKAVAAGLPGLHLNAVVWGQPILPTENKPVDAAQLVRELSFDSVTSYVWIHHVVLPKQQTDYDYVRDAYFAYWDKAEKQFAVPYFPNVTMGWDSSPRANQEDEFGNFGYPFMNTIGGNTPERFRAALEMTKDRLLARPDGPRIVNINCWNEWTEGSYLEPDVANGMKYLEAVRDVFGVIP